MRRLPTLDAEVRRRLLARAVVRDGCAHEEFEGRERELAAYLDRSAGRFARALPLVDAALSRTGGGRVLELGADPWLFTQLLLERGVEVVSAGQRRGAWREDATQRTPERVALSWGGRDAKLEHHLFDAERERWPFADATFDVVLCMEVVEHLVFSPAHLLHEANRVLRRGGALVLTTPNAAAAAKLARLLRGRNVHGPYSGYGAHGRHNREFVAAELETVFAAAGFEADLRAANIAGYEPEEPLARVLRAVAPRRRGDHLFVLAHAVGAPRLEFPPGLYRSFDRERLRREGVVLVDERETRAPEAEADGSERGVVERRGAPVGEPR
jgi:SAM-dependent methyltransferase